MTGQQMYEIQQAESARLHATDALNQGMFELIPWDQLGPALQAAWDRRAMEQNRRDA